MTWAFVIALIKVSWSPALSIAARMYVIVAASYYAGQDRSRGWMALAVTFAILAWCCWTPLAILHQVKP